MKYAKKILLQFAFVFLYTLMFLYASSELLLHPKQINDFIDLFGFIVGILLLIMSAIILVFLVISLAKGEDI